MSVVTLVAIAVAVGAVQGGAVAERSPHSRTILRDASAARAVAAAVTAAVRDMVGHDTIDASVAYECAESLACLHAFATFAPSPSETGRSHVPPIAPRLLNIPPPTN